jgi:hypothetical protein
METSKGSTEIPEGMDLRIEREESEMGLQKVTITAYTLQAEIDLATEYPRILKLLERDWAIDEAEADDH